MKPGYASTLVARSRGQAPLLLPITPSRFEPDGHPADLQDDVTVEHQTESAPAPMTDVAVPERAPVQVDRGVDSPPLLGWRQAPISPRRDDFVGSATQPTAVPTADERVDRRDRPSMPPPAERPDAPLMPNATPAREAGPAQPERLNADPGEALGPAATAQANREPAHLAERIIAARRTEADDRSAARSATAHDRINDDPPIVVRIGRLDVRSVQAPVAPKPQPRPRPAATPTLEERLAARDRQ